MRFAYYGGPLLVVAYGVARLIDGLDGSKGPGPAWIIGHLFFLAGLALFAVLMVGLSNLRRGPLASAALVAGVLGAVGMARVVVIDIIVAWDAADRAEMDRTYPEYDDFPGLPAGWGDVIDEVAGILFPLGFIVLLVLLAVGRRLPWWSPVAGVAGFVAILLTLDLLPVAGVLLLISLLPAATTRSPVPAATRP